MNNRSLRSLVAKTAALYLAWLLLSQSFSPFHLGLGLATSLAVARLSSVHGSPYGGKVRWIRLFLYPPWLLGKIVQSGIYLAYLILHPRLPIDPKLIRYQTRLAKPVGIVVLGNSITLTPGTITAEVNSTELVVHAMDDASGEDLTSLRMERKLAAIFGVTP